VSPINATSSVHLIITFTQTIRYKNYEAPYNALRYAVAQLVEALHYKLEGCGFDSRGVIGIFYWHNPSGRTMALGSTQPVIETSTRDISWGGGG